MWSLNFTGDELNWTAWEMLEFLPNLMQTMAGAGRNWTRYCHTCKEGQQSSEKMKCCRLSRPWELNAGDLKATKVTDNLGVGYSQQQLPVGGQRMSLLPFPEDSAHLAAWKGARNNYWVITTMNVLRQGTNCSCSCYFLVPKKNSTFRPILDLRSLNRFLKKYERFKMLMLYVEATDLHAQMKILRLQLGRETGVFFDSRSLAGCSSLRNQTTPQRVHRWNLFCGTKWSQLNDA